MSRVRSPLPAPNVATPAPLGFRAARSSAPGLRSRGARLLPSGRLRAPRPGLSIASRRDQPNSCNQSGSIRKYFAREVFGFRHKGGPCSRPRAGASPATAPSPSNGDFALALGARPASFSILKADRGRALNQPPICHCTFPAEIHEYTIDLKSLLRRMRFPAFFPARCLSAPRGFF